MARERASASAPFTCLYYISCKRFDGKARLWTEDGVWEITRGGRLNNYRYEFLGRYSWHTAEHQAEYCQSFGIDFWVLGKAGPHRFGEVPPTVFRYSKQVCGEW